MASNTPNLNLYKKDPTTEGEDTFNLETMLNENWDKIDGNTQKNIIKAPTAPTSPVADDLWLDTSISPNILKRFDGTEWVNIGKTPPVTSVNNKTGAVELTASDVGAEPAFTKNSAFNKNFGITAGTVADGGDVAAHLAESASLTVKGHVQLNSATNSTDETTAATPKAVKEAIDYAKIFGIGVTDAPLPPSDDFNLVTKTGVYRADSSQINQPPMAHNCLILHMARTSSNAVQFAISRTSSRAFFRKNEAGVWGEWFEIWHSGNQPQTTVSSTAPSAPKTNDLWIDTSS